MMKKLGGILGRRISLTQQRLLEGDCPKFTPEFILADVQAIDRTNRRFSDFSGDLSGRFLGALSLLPADGSLPRLHKLARKILRLQAADGRFGNPDIHFVDTKIGRSHMPLLWGNGRLLVGLLEYHERSQDEKVLQAAVRLGNFLIQVISYCLKPEHAEYLKSQGYHGFICCTQCNEGLVMLGEVTGDKRYLQTAEAIADWVLPRGKQHSHGYLTTLRGMLMLHAQKGKSSLLKTVEGLFSDLIKSSDYLSLGGVPEYFGWEADSLGTDASVALHSTNQIRDEGCSEADFLRLALQLWQATGQVSYLEKAEHCLLNHLLSNQFSNGDFGHRHFSHSGIKPHSHPGRAWWCCTMHGLRAFKDIETAAITREDDCCRVNLFLDGDISSDDLSVKFQNSYDRANRRHLYTATISRASSKAITFSFRDPEWVRATTLRVNGKKVKALSKSGYFHLLRKWKVGDRIEVEQRYRFRFQTRDNQMHSYKAAPTSSVIDEAALHYGPWLLAIHDSKDALFFCEPYQTSFIHLPKSEDDLEKHWHQTKSDSSTGFLKLNYTHDGFTGTHSVSFRPVCQLTNADHGSIDYFVKYKTSQQTA